VLVVGAGLAGAVVAERMASDPCLRVLVIDRRDHIAGNAYDEIDERGVRIHRYGPHIFHTNAARVIDYLSRFTDWLPYEHRVRAVVDGAQVPIPINRTTLNLLYDLDLRTEQEAKIFFDARAEARPRIESSEDVVVARVGRDLYERLYRGYTTKQWGLDPSRLGAEVCARIPIRYDTDDRYFTDRFQQMPANGYTAMVARILDHDRIDVQTGTDYADVPASCRDAHLVWTGPIDELFDFQLGRLPYRSLRFDRQWHPTPAGNLLQSVAVLNHPAPDVPYTRVTEFRHLTGQRSYPWTTLCIEYPSDNGEPYYPVPQAHAKELFRRYRRLADDRDDVTLVGRLARYQYLNMDQVVAQALMVADRLADRLRPGR
jgi:UDP-galactopyranose mutase